MAASRTRVFAASSLFLALVAVTVALLLSYGDEDRASASAPAAGYDVDTTGNTATSLGPIDDCREIASIGTIFTVDIYAQVDDLYAWGAWIGYDPTVVWLVGRNDFDNDGVPNEPSDLAELFQGAQPGSNLLINDQDTPDTDGEYFMEIADRSVIEGGGDSGEGILTRLKFQAVNTGIGALTFPVDIVGNGLYLVDSYNQDIGDGNDDGIFDSPTTATIAVGQPGTCDMDSDDDGVLDPADLCPDTAPGDPVDANGCSDAQVDNDNDGVCDPGALSDGPSGCIGSDSCPATAPGDPVDANGCSQTQVDNDLDGICDPGKTSTWCTGSDNCPITYNPGQEDGDGDGLGDACDTMTDNDGDGVDDGIDNCLGVYNPSQTDTDGDLQGDACDDDDDNDTYPDISDNCPLNYNPAQEDFEGDGLGDPCDPDDDNDLNDDVDELACDSDPLNAAEQPERLGNSTDDDNDGSTDETQPIVPGADCDGDGYNDNLEDALTWPPALDDPETNCTDIGDDDGDTVVNDGCPQPGTGHQCRCPDSGATNDEEDDSWSADFNDDAKLNLIDVNSFNVPIKHFGGIPLADHARWNVAGGTSINLADVNNLGTLKPPMLNGERAFGNTMWGTSGACLGD